MWQLDTMLYLLAHSRNYGIYIYIYSNKINLLQSSIPKRSKTKFI